MSGELREWLAFLYLRVELTRRLTPSGYDTGQTCCYAGYERYIMTNKAKQKLTLDRPATYQIKVPGELDESWLDWAGEMKVIVESDDNGLLVSTLIGTIDQAALQGLLRRLYSLGMPLISVICLEVE